MIINLLLSVVVNIVGGIFYFLPIVTIDDIPYIGETVRNTLISVAQTWNAFEITLPYLISLKIAIMCVVGFELLLLIGKFFLGGRMPNN